MKASSPLDRRAQVRRTINRDFASLDEPLAEYVNNISRSGAFIRSDHPLPIGTRLDLRFTVILDDLEIIEGIGEVVRVIPSGSSEAPGMGVVFRELEGSSREVIEKLLVRR